MPNAVGNIPEEGGLSKMADAIDFAANRMWPLNGGRADANKVMIVFSVGRPFGKYVPVSASSKQRTRPMRLFLFLKPNSVVWQVDTVPTKYFVA